MAVSDNLIAAFAVRMGDNCLILGQRVAAWCGHAPALEEDIALANTGLDLIGQTKNWYDLACREDGALKTPDDLAFLRDARAFQNCLLVEQPDENYAHTLMRQFLFDAWHYLVLEGLSASNNVDIAGIAEKSIKEVRYHRARSTDLIIRLGDGGDESRSKMQEALNVLWRFTGELTTADALDEEVATKGVAPSLALIADPLAQYLNAALTAATLAAPSSAMMRTGGKSGLHTESFGFLIAEMQTLQRSYPGVKW